MTVSQSSVGLFSTVVVSNLIIQQTLQ